VYYIVISLCEIATLSSVILHVARVAVLKPLPPGSEVHGTVTLGM